MDKIKKDDLSVLKQAPFTEAVKQLEELMSQSNRSFLLGAGCSYCAGLPLTAEFTSEVLKDSSLSNDTKEILSAIQNNFGNSDITTIEDYMSELVDLTAMAERRIEKKAQQSEIQIGNKKYKEPTLKEVLMQIKEAIACSINSKSVDITTHRQFVTAIHRILRSGKTESMRPVDYYILNYDTLIEDSLALERVLYSDGFSGGSTAWWDPETFKKRDVIARVLKVHGSIDWCQLEDDLVPRRIRAGGKGFSGVTPQRKVIIWPAATKYQETQKDPYAQIIAIMRDSLRPLLHSEAVFAICGYRFNDSHINIEIERALYESDGRLTVLIFTEFPKPEGQIKKWHEDNLITEQVRIYAKRGFFHGKVKNEATSDLPWWKFENLVRLLGGER